MPTVNELLRDSVTDHAIDLQQYSTHVVRRLIGLLNRVDADLAAALARALDRLPAVSFTVERLESLLVSVRRMNLQAYVTVNKSLTAELAEFAAVEANYQMDLLRSVIPRQIQYRFRVGRISIEQVRAASMSRPFQGRLLRDWTKKLGADRMDVIRNAVRLGYVEGETTSQIVRRIRGTRENLYADGAIQRSRRDLEAVVRTAVNHTAAAARDYAQKANADIIAAVVWTSTLDSRTTEKCIVRDGKRYSVDGHKPIGHRIPWLGGPGKIHWNCRSVAVPVLKSWRQLGIDESKLPASTRASMDGQVPADTTFADWIKRQSAYRQDQVLGPTRGRLMRDGGMKVPDFYSPSGQFLTLDDLKERNAAAFERAGL